MDKELKTITVTERFTCNNQEIEVSGKCYFDGFSIDELLDRVSLSEVKEYVMKQEALNG